MTTGGRPEHLEGYERFFGLTEAPFSLTPMPRFLFESAGHAAALAQIAYALERREPLVVVTGEIGTGKTLLCRTVLQRLERKTFLSVITDPLLERDDLLLQLLEDFGAIAKERTRLIRPSRHGCIQTLEAFLRSLVPIHAHAVVIIDEAQHLKPDVLEQIRLLANIDDERGTLLQIILVGQPDLEMLLARSELRQLEQRVSRRFQLQPLTAGEVQHYIEHRLALARGPAQSQLPGARELARALAEWDEAWEETPAGVEFTPDAVQAVWTLAGGVPRVVNLLCDRALEGAYRLRRRVIDAPLIDAAAGALGLAPLAVAPGQQASAFATVSEPAARDDSFGAVTLFEPDVADEPHPPAEEPVHVVSGTLPRPRTSPALRTYLVPAALVAAAAVGIFLGVRSAKPSPARTPRSEAVAPASSAMTAPSARLEPRPAIVSGSLTDPAAGTRTSTPPAVTAPGPQAAAQANGALFEILVAAFRTDARATSVAADVATLGLPTRRRAADDWQQVVSGPFASRAEAEDAQQRLDHAGFAGTQIVATAR